MNYAAPTPCRADLILYFNISFILATSAGSSLNNSLTFFFQAEDGIRALYVTGVQTCPLPIYLRRSRFRPPIRRRGVRQSVRDRRFCANRSEERRVGKECRERWSPYE